MDHSHMDHSGMDMGGDRCSMNMLFTWNTNNLCIVFRQWHIRGPGSLILSLLAIVAITAGYEALRAAARRYDERTTRHPDALPNLLYSSISSHDQTQQQQQQPAVTESTPFLTPTIIAGRNSNSTSTNGGGGDYSSNNGGTSKQVRLVKSALYGLQNFYAFMIMLLFMTYNGWVMIAVAVGAGVGYWFFGSSGQGTRAYKETACH
ncbi:Ctr copper transporter [Microdochium trichocladiopsis]|uniref:Copper transport protein n=1 Tax=Microdochium trichocladiopsis TaxID=1682393 RepID=A0A9P8YDZ1_9PEZI|nr:Ctr copper transporter [Microdochium trichocladiopsis]KAH7035201.1 Ctr copper transporter [Microdochium trichocladiopsis]